MLRLAWWLAINLKCSKCKEEKDESNFGWRKTGVKRNGICKECVRIYNQNHYKKNLEYYKRKTRRSNKQTYDRNSKFLLEVKMGNPCEKCGENRPETLVFDHIDPKDKKYNISFMRARYSLNAILNEIKKCRILCANCHSIRTSKQFNWHNRND